MHQYIKPIALNFSGSADTEKAIAMKAYLKDQYNFFGIPTPQRRNIYKDYMRQNLLENQAQLATVVKELWMLPEREFQYFAIESIIVNKKIWQASIIDLCEFCIINKSWWDTVDVIAYDCVGTYFKLFPEQTIPVTKKWNASPDIWLQRTSLLFQKSYKNNTDTTLLAVYILNLASSKEFFIQKAIGWILREYAKTNAAWVKTFVSQHTLAPLSKREALKHLTT